MDICVGAGMIGNLSRVVLSQSGSGVRMLLLCTSRIVISSNPAVVRLEGSGDGVLLL